MRSTPLRRFGFAFAITVLLAGACDRVDSGSAGTPAFPAEDAGYMAPPILTQAGREAGRLTLSGRAPPGAQVRLASPEGQVHAARAGGSGVWELVLPIPKAPSMLAFWAETGDRAVRSEGALFVAPAPSPPALLLRPGFGALSLAGPREQPELVAVDYDPSGGAAVAGLARPNAAVRLSLDGVQAGIGQADAQGRFAVVAANLTLEDGVRRIEVETPQGGAEAMIRVSPVQPLGSLVYRATRQTDGWRIDWAPPGGGVQTTLVFDVPGTRP